jgi:hypothetical protein
MWRLLERQKMLAEYWWEIRKERDSLEDLGVDGILLLRRILRKHECRPSTEAVRLMTGTSDLVVWRRENFRLFKT